MQGVSIEPSATDNDYYVYTIKIPISDLHILWEFKKYVIDKYGKQRGYMGKELMNAVSFYLDHTTKNERVFKSKHQRTKLIKYARLLLQYKEISHKELIQLIAKNMGVHKDTIRNYINYAFTFDFLKVKMDKGFNNKIYIVNEGHIRRFLGEEYYEDKKQFRKDITQKIKELKKEISQTETIEEDDEMNELKRILSAKPIED